MEYQDILRVVIILSISYTVYSVSLIIFKRFYKFLKSSKKGNLIILDELLEKDNVNITDIINFYNNIDKKDKELAVEKKLILSKLLKKGFTPIGIKRGTLLTLEKTDMLFLYYKERKTKSLEPLEYLQNL